MIGVPLGAISGYYGGWVDLSIQRVVDVLLSFPAFCWRCRWWRCWGWAGERDRRRRPGRGARVRAPGARLDAVDSPPQYVEAARGFGASGLLIILRHVLPNALPPVVIQATLGLGSTLLTAAGLGFLGLGVQGRTPEWGAMLGEGRQYIFRTRIWRRSPAWPSLTVLGFNLAGDGLRDALDPTLTRLARAERRHESTAAPLSVG